MSKTATNGQNRILSLDGLRGVAAAAVVLFHLLLMSPELSAIRELRSMPQEFTLTWWFTMTPLRVFWAGSEFVYVFFILSGFVLARSAMRLNFNWMSFFIQRFVRLYVPVWASIFLAWLSITLVARRPDGLGSSWLSRRSDHYDWERLRTDATLVFGAYDFTLSPLWSLRWEILFSALLPIYLWVFSRLRRKFLLNLLLVSLAISVGSTRDWPEFLFLPMFGIGCLFALNWSELESAVNVYSQNHVLALLLLSTCVTLLTSTWWLLQIGFLSEYSRWLVFPSLIGAVGLVLVIPNFRLTEIFFSWRPLTLLGKVSFSLYLTHESVIIAVRYMFVDASLMSIAPIAGISSLIVCTIFYIAIEKPSQALGRRFATRPVCGISE